MLICTYNRHVLLDGTLRSLAACDPPPDRVVVVNGGDEQADGVIQIWAEKGLAVERIPTKNINLSVSRNVGLKHCSADIIAMTDDDAEVLPDWISEIRRSHQAHSEAGGIGGPVIGTTSHTLVGKVADLTTFPAYSRVQEVRTLPGVNISYKRSVIEAVGDYDPSLFRGEDVDYNWRILQEGSTILFDPAIRVRHHHRSSAKSLIQQHYMYGKAYYRLRGKWPDMYCVYPHKLNSLRAVRKLIWFFVAPLVGPVAQACKLGAWGVPALPLLYAREIAWRFGIILQAMIDRKGKNL